MEELQFLRSEPATAQSVREALPEDSPVDPGSLPDHPVTNLDFDVTENCNLGCTYCFKGEMYTKSMSLEAMKKTFEWLLLASGAEPSVNCNFMGGEPTMRFKQIKKFVPWARRRGQAIGKEVTFSMTTNLTLFTDEMRAFVDDFGFGVLMSIDGSPEVQEAQRPAKNGKSSAQIVEYWAKELLKTRPKAQARATLHPDYVDHLSSSVAYLKSIGFREAVVAASEYQEWRPETFEVLEKEYAKVVEFVADGFRRGDDFNLTSFKYYISKLIHPRASDREDEIEFQREPCGAGKGYLMVDYTGDIWPCHRFDGADTAAEANGQFRLGSIYQEGFNRDLQQAFLDFDHSKVHKESCNTCPVNETCGGYCPAANRSDAGSIYTPHDAFCQWSQTTYRFAESLYSVLREEGGAPFERLLATAAGTKGTGEK